MGREGFSTAAAWLLLLVSWETQGGRRVAGLCRHVRGPRVRKLKALQRSLQLIGACGVSAPSRRGADARRHYADARELAHHLVHVGVSEGVTVTVSVTLCCCCVWTRC